MPTKFHLAIPLALLVVAAGCLEVAPTATDEEDVNPGALELPDDVAALVAGAPCFTALPQPDFHPDAEVQEWTGDVSANVTRGVLDVQSFDGGVRILPWGQDGYRVQVGEVDSDDRLTPAVDATVEDGLFQLTVTVDDAGPADAGPGDLLRVNEERPMAQVMVWVPQMHYDRVDVTDRPESSSTADGFGLFVDTQPTGDVWRTFITGNLTGGALDAHFLDIGAVVRDVAFTKTNVTTLDGDVAAHGLAGESVRLGSHDGDVCASAVASTRLAAETLDGDVAVRGAAANTTRAASHDGAVTVEGLRGDALEASSLDGDVGASNATAAQVTLKSHDGDVAAQGVTATNLTLTSLDGDVRVRDVDAPALRASTHDGSVAVDGARVARLNATSLAGYVAVNATPTATGWMRVGSHEGAVALRVPTGEAYGYNATAATHDGRAVVNLTGAETVDAADDGTREHARTVGFQERAVQVQVRATSMDGDVTVMDQ